ncbi:MAG: hypothetical protein KF865_10415 [Bdellovibrionaceae bacterium]|nr:hypothetical protein [Pseudobdellovibrionaceae bacterium]
MKQVIFSLLVVLGASVGQAKVADFNALIGENMRSQEELQQEMRHQMGETRTARQDKREVKVFVDPKGHDINVPTTDLRFRKEMVDHSPSQKDVNNRLANEIQASEYQF